MKNIIQHILILLLLPLIGQAQLLGVIANHYDVVSLTGYVNFTDATLTQASSPWTNYNLSAFTAATSVSITGTTWTIIKGTSTTTDGPHTDSYTATATSYFPANVLQTQWWSDGTTGYFQVVIGGLDNTKYYSFRVGIFDNSGGTNGPTTVSFIGATTTPTQSTGETSTGTEYELAFTSRIKPTSGNITMKVQASAGYSVTNGLIIYQWN